MPFCARCGKPLTCECKAEQPVGESIIGCGYATKPGAIWVHITDDAGINVPTFPITGYDATNSMGLSVKDGLAEGKYKVELGTPDPTILDLYDLPVERSKDKVLVYNGAISYVSFLLKRKVELEVEFVWKSKPSERFPETPKVQIVYTGDGTAPADPTPVTANGYKDLGRVSSGKYVLTPDYTSLADPSPFVLDAVAQDLQLAPGQLKKMVTFLIGKKAKLKVEIIWKPDPAVGFERRLLSGDTDVEAGTPGKPGTAEADDIDDMDVTAELIGSGAPKTVKAKKGVADFGWLEPGKYDVTPVFSQLKPCRYDWTDETRKVTLIEGDDKTEEFQVEPLYRKAECFAHVLLTIPDQIYELSTGDASKVEVVTATDGSKTYNYKTYTVSDGLFKLNDVPSVKAKMAFTLKDKGYRFKVGNSPDLWTEGDLDLVDLQKVRLEQAGTTGVYKLVFYDRTNTLPYTQANLSGVWRSKYHGYPDDRADIDARVAFLSDTLAKAYAKANPSPVILKVFMIPECYFQGLHGAYLTADKDYLIGKLLDVVKGAEWKDWVLSFGTVNSVHVASAPTGITYNGNIYEMRNDAPVIRGGIGASGVTSTRLIRKVLNSAELADGSTLIADTQCTRPQAVNENVQFMGDKEDNAVADLLAKLLNDGTAGPLFISKGMPDKLWSDPGGGLKEEIKSILGNWGIARVARAIRLNTNIGVSKALADWVFGATDGLREPASHLMSEDEATFRVIQKQWPSSWPGVELNTQAWEDEPNRKQVLEDIQLGVKAACEACGFTMKIQQDKISLKVADLVPAAHGKDFYPVSLPDPKFQPSIFPVWRELVDIYADEHKLVRLVCYDKGSKETLELEDYCFAGPRKAGAWYSSLSEARSKDPCKSIVFGVEICADHADERLQFINKKSPIGIDIQLVPSAGMRPKYDATRTGGFTFNCDGWNKKPDSGGRCLEEHFDGPSPFVGKVGGYDVDVTPVYPHSVVVHSGTPLVPELVAPGPDPTKCEVIFTKRAGCAGELHYYAAQTLPS